MIKKAKFMVIIKFRLSHKAPYKAPGNTVEFRAIKKPRVKNGWLIIKTSADEKLTYLRSDIEKLDIVRIKGDTND